MEFSTAFLVLTAALQTAEAPAMNTDRYALPASKTHLQQCEKAALELHPGQIERLHMLHRAGSFLVRYEIVGRDGSEWVVLCDGSTGEIVGEQKLIDAAP